VVKIDRKFDMITVESVDGIPLRLSDERIEHIEEHLYLNIETVLDAISYPDFVIRGRRDSKIALLNLSRNNWLNVVYKEFIKKNDGFIITAYTSTNVSLTEVLWER
jgi:hypothetical protein